MLIYAPLLDRLCDSTQLTASQSRHLFQNRYTSIVCEEDAYFMELIRYIHLNPLRARIVKTLEELDNYRWCGHHSVAQQTPLPWYDATYVLRHFGSLKAYQPFMREGIEKKHVPDLDGGGLVRSLGGRANTLQQRNDPVRADVRILGTGDFVKGLLEQETRYASLQERRTTMTSLIEHHCNRAGILPQSLQGGNRARNISALRSELAHLLVRDLGISYAEIGRQLGISTSGVSRIMRRREDESR